MHPVYRTLIFTAISLFSLILTISRCQRRQAYQQRQVAELQKGWTPELEQQMYDVFYTQSSAFNTTDSVRREFSSCCLIKMKAMFPNGLSGMEQMTDSVKIAVMKMGADCSKIVTKNIDIWQPEVVQQLKLQFYSYPEIKLLPQNVKKEYVDCLSFKVTTHFSHGLTDSSAKKDLKKVIEKARNGCLVMIANKYEKLKVKKDTTKIR
ncbi:hypothetical protein [Mucilaginibacter sp.]|uniref:hypothetical protein n=1 Tax=Mucilaginibacter sp. TaxID=1882438 RepID=UPI002ED5FCE0